MHTKAASNAMGKQLVLFRHNSRTALPKKSTRNKATSPDVATNALAATADVQTTRAERGGWWRAPWAAAEAGASEVSAGAAACQDLASQAVRRGLLFYSC